MHIYAWNPRSQSAALLADLLDAFRIRHHGSRFIGRPRKVVINWGASQVPDEVAKCTVLNTPLRLAYMTNKLKFFELCKRAWRQPNYTTVQETAEQWRRSGFDVCERHTLNGHSALGLVLRSADGRVPCSPAPLYTKYIPKKSEYRVHCIKTDEGTQTFVQRKARSRDVPDNEVNWQIRNLEGGFVYAVSEDTPPDVVEQATKCFVKTGLDFGAIDVIWNEKRNKAYVLEVNTAPGLEERTANFYSENFRRRVESLLHM